jgi:hypothetical protein
VVITQAISGLFISDEVFSDGPYYGVLGESAQNVANFLHHNVFNLLLGFIGLHLAAIVYYKIVLKKGLTKAMFTGTKEVAKEGLQESPPFPWIGLAVSLFITALAMYLILEVLPPPPSDDFFMY